MARLIERVGEDRYRFNANYKKIWQKLLEYEEIGTVEEFKELKQSKTRTNYTKAGVTK